MFRLDYDLDAGKLIGFAFSPGSSGQDVLSATLYSQPSIEIYAKRPSWNSDLGVDLGSDPTMQVIVKSADETDTQRFDEAALLPSPVFTRINGGTTIGYYYKGALDLANPALLKRFNVDPVPAKEFVTFATIGSGDDDSFNGRWIDIYTSDSAYGRYYMKVGGLADSPPAAGTGGTLYRVDVASTPDAATVAAAFVSKITAVASTTWTANTEVDAFTIQAVNPRHFGNHQVGTSGFTIFVSEAGSAGLAASDVTSLSFNVWIAFLDGTNPQVAGPFTLTITNSGYRPTTPPALGVSGFSRRGAVALGSGVDFKAVTFDTVMPSASWVMRDCRVVNTTDPAAIGTFTVNTGTDVLTVSATHGLAVNDRVRFTTTTTLPAGLTAGTDYYVLTVPSGTTLTLSATMGGSTLDITTTGTGTHTITTSTPDFLVVGTMTARSAAGFTVLLSGPTNTAHYVLEYTADYAP